MKLIYIEWEDAASSTEWHSETDMEKWFDEVVSVKQVGWLYKESKTMLFLVGRTQEWAGDWEDMYGNLQKIPKTWIRKRIDLTKHIATQSKANQ